MPAPTTSNGRLKGRACLLTGATSGIGKTTALELARLGADLTLIARDRARGEATVQEIKAATGNPKVTLLLADLSSQASIRNVAGEFKKQRSRLDLLINNAGAIFTERKVTADGFEATFATNHLGYFLLTHLLVDLLKA